LWSGFFFSAEARFLFGLPAHKPFAHRSFLSSSAKDGADLFLDSIALWGYFFSRNGCSWRQIAASDPHRWPEEIRADKHDHKGPMREGGYV
jgi:hypothetical protein